MPEARGGGSIRARRSRPDRNRRERTRLAETKPRPRREGRIMGGVRWAPSI